MEQIILDLAVKYPLIMGLCAAIGAFRVVFKPIMAGVKSVVVATETKADDAILEQVESSRAYKGLVWVVDYLLSIKLPVAKK